MVQKKLFKLQANIVTTFNLQKPGFQKNHLTDLYLKFLHDKILKGFDKGLMIAVVLIDLQKAFDTIDHDILLKKLSAIAFSNHTVGSFKSYLSNRLVRANLENLFRSFPYYM